MDEFPPRLPEDLLGEAIRLLAASDPLRTLPVRGGSMLPTLRDGQRIAVEFGCDAPERGDLLVFRQGRDLVVHRYLGPAWFPDGRAGLRTRGDNRPELDPHVDPRRVLGRVVAVEEGNGWVDLRCGVAQLYGLAVAFHDLAWAAMAVVARRVDRTDEDDGAWYGRVAACDRRLLGLAHRWLFARMRRRLPLAGTTETDR